MEYPQNNETMPLKDGFNFTPRMRIGDGFIRVRMRISETDHNSLGRGRGLQGIVTDLDTGKRYKVYGASCGLPRCMCDSKITETTK